MRQRLEYVFTVAVTIAVLLAGCSKSGDSSTEPQLTAPTMPAIVFKGPATTSTDANAQMVKSLVASFNAYTLAFAPYSAIPAVQKGNVWTWTYTQGTLTVTFTGTSQVDGSYAWKMLMNGADTSSGVTYNNWTVIDGTSSADGKNGSFKMYDTNSTTQTGEFTWTTVNNVLTGTQKGFDPSAGAPQIVIVNNPDNTGEMRTYSGTTLNYKAVWQPNGSGQWWSYDSNGQQNGTGNWI